MDDLEQINIKIKRGNKPAFIFAAVSALAAAGLCIVQPYISNAAYYMNFAPPTDVSGERTSVTSSAIERSNYCRNIVYSQLCRIGTIYLSNCRNGKYTGSKELYENLYGTLDGFDHDYEQFENLFGLDNASDRPLKIEQSNYTITNIDSDYYYFFISYGSEYLTNIPDIKTSSNIRVSYIGEQLKEKNNDWYYFRENDKISVKSKYDESGLGKTEVYYTIADENGKPFKTSEYIDSDKLLLGGCSVDNFGRYQFCFDSQGDRIVIDAPYDDDAYKYLDEDGTMHLEGRVADSYYDDYTITADDPLFAKYIAADGGVSRESGEWLDIEDIPGIDYTLTNISTNELTLFMSPKRDIVGTSSALIRKYSEQYKIFSGIQAGLVCVWCAGFAGVFFALIFRKRESYIAEGTPLPYRFFKADSSIIVFAAAGIMTAVLISDVTSTYGYVFSPNHSETLVKMLLMLAGHAAAFISLGGIVRQFKLHGFRERPDFLAADIFRRTKRLRGNVSERFGRLRFVQKMRETPLIIRQKRRLRLMFICGAVFLFLALLWNSFGDLFYHGFYADWVILLPLLVLCIGFGISYIIASQKAAKDFSALEEQINRMLTAEESGGELIHSENALKVSSPLYPLGEKLAEISDRAEKAVEERVKSERTKVELVTNVSHDLKTPLTSIISYIDLLKGCELPDDARDYVSILERKGDKLREIVADVFTLAKTVSGVEVDLTELDLAVLVRQVIADDYTENAGEMNVEIKTDITVSAAPITADSAKLRRVIQNILDNAVKYSLPGTRVYLALTESGSGFDLTLRNICEKEPDFTADEILERFVRGDKSRTDGGSGLGLSIAKAFTEACGGSFRVEIDKDIFRVMIFFEKRDIKDTETDVIKNDKYTM